MVRLRRTGPCSWYGFGKTRLGRKNAFIAAFNHHAQSTYHATTPDAYAQTLKKGSYAGAGSLGGLAFGSTILLIPMIAFFNLWSNWGATLYGEVRGASDFRKNIIAMCGALVVTTIGAVIFFLLIVAMAAMMLHLRQRTMWTEIGGGA